MPSYTITVLGLDLSFKTDADPDRVAAARRLVEERYKMLNTGGKNLSKEKFLAFVAMGLADDLLVSDQKLGDVERKLDKLLKKIDE